VLRNLIAAGSIAAVSLVGLVRCMQLDEPKMPRSAVQPQVKRERPGADLAAACGEGGLTDHGRTRIRRQPYLQNVSQHSASVLWTAVAGNATVEVTTPAAKDVARARASVDRSARVPRARQLTATVDSLQPGSIYCYVLRDEGGPLTRRAGFRTAPARGSGVPLRFAAFGDSGDGSAGQFKVLRQLGTVPFELLLVTGDLAYTSGTLEQLESRFFGVYHELLRSVPVMPVAGNHEHRTDDAAPFREVFQLPENGGDEGKERWFSFDYGDVHFVGLDTELMGAAQAAWLERDLQRNSLPWTVVYGHKPPYSSGMHGSDADFREHFGAILERHKVPLVLTGHEHHYERTTPIRGVTYVVTGGGGASPRSVDVSRFTAFSESVLHFVQVTVEDERMSLVAIDDDGRVFDSVTIER
jgi:3',5'-cyclic AMP phosphodiesterase CpdA